MDDIFGNLKRFEEEVIHGMTKNKEQGFLAEPFWVSEKGKLVDSMECQVMPRHWKQTITVENRSQ